MMGGLFYRKVPPSEIKSMGFKEMKYWDKWHKSIEKGYKNAIKEIQDGN